VYNSDEPEQLSKDPPMIGRVGLAVVLVVALAIPSGAMAVSLNGNVMIKNWAAADRCAAAAQRQFPDYTPESNARRDNALKQCLAGAYLPPR
jgi:hypothetical protein